MTAFLLSLHSEFLKTRKTSAFWIAILLPLVICTLDFVGFYVYSDRVMNYPPLVLWMRYVGAILSVMGSLILPMFVIFLAYSINSIEHRADMWKSMFTLPIHKWTLYASKYLYAVLLVAVCLGLFASLLLLSGNLLGVLKPELKFGEYDISGFVFLIHLKLFLAALGILSIQFVFSLLWADFLKPMGIGFCAFIVGMISASMSWKYAWTIPYSHPLMAIQSASRKTLGPDLHIDLLTKEVYVSLAVAAGMFVLGYFIVAKRSVK